VVIILRFFFVFRINLIHFSILFVRMISVELQLGWKVPIGKRLFKFCKRKVFTSCIIYIFVMKIRILFSFSTRFSIIRQSIIRYGLWRSKWYHISTITMELSTLYVFEHWL